MSAIDRLKNGSGIISFDATSNAPAEKTVKSGQSMDIDMMGGNDSVKGENSEMNLSN